MTQRWTLITLMLVALGISACQSEPPVDNAETQVLALERRALDQWAAGNPVGYIQAFADDATYFDDIGAQSLVDGLDAMRTYAASLQGKIPPHRYEIVDPKVQVLGDVAILSLQYHASDSDGKPLVQWKATSVYRMTEGQWRVVHAHWSKVKDS